MTPILLQIIKKQHILFVLFIVFVLFKSFGAGRW